MKYGVIKINLRYIVLLFTALIISAVTVHGTVKSVSVSVSKRSLPIYSVETSEKKVSMGFNCAWDNEDIPQLIQILDEYGVKASFFVSGSWCVKYPESVKALYDTGHEIGSHSNTHADLAKLGRDAILDEITLCNEKIKAIIGIDVKLFRMPSGSYNNLVIDTVKSQGMYPIQWDVDSVDYNNPTPGQMKERIIGGLRNGSIMLFHSGAKNTPEALPAIIDEIKAQGYEIVPVSELIYLEPYTIDFEGRQHKA